MAQTYKQTRLTLTEARKAAAAMQAAIKANPAAYKAAVRQAQRLSLKFGHQYVVCNPGKIDTNGKQGVFVVFAHEPDWLTFPTCHSIHCFYNGKAA